MLVTPPFGASSNIALWRADNKPPLEVVVANLEHKLHLMKCCRMKYTVMITDNKS